MDRKWSFRHGSAVVAVGAVLLFLSLLLAAEGAFALMHGVAAAAHREGPDFGVFGGSVLLVASVVGLAGSGFLLRGRRTGRCQDCGSTDQNP